MIKIYPTLTIQKLISSVLFKQLGLAFVLSFIVFNSFSQEEEKEAHHCLFEEKSLSVGIAAPLSLDLLAPGVNLRMYYNVGERICFGPEYSFLKKGDVEVVDFNFVGHYIFETKWVGIYPLVGANYSVESEENLVKEIDAAFGIVFGGGLHRNFNNITMFAEYSRVEFGITDQFITGGVMYTFK